jgi:biopolymer transport protein ExbD
MTPEEALIAKKLAIAKKERRDKEPYELAFNITSLMDALTIILIFLLKSYGSDPMQVPQKKNELMVPKSDTLSSMAECVDIQISRTSIVVKGKKVITITNMQVASADAPDNFVILSLKDKLDEVRSKEIEDRLNKDPSFSAKKFKGETFISADEEIPWKLVNQVLITAVRAKYARFSFSVIKTRGS